MNIKKLARFFTGDLPNSKAIPIADFVVILENNLGLQDDGLNKRKYLFWSISSDYVRLISFLLGLEAGEWIIAKLLEYFDLPNDFICSINFSKYGLCSCNDGEDYIKNFDSLNETDFSRDIVMPLLHKMWYSNISYKWKVYQTDYWNDFYPMEFRSPWWIIHYTWVQVKATKMSDWDTSEIWKSTNDLISELRTWFSQDHTMIDWNKIYLSEFIVFNNKTIPESTREKIFWDKELKDKKIIIYDKDWVISLFEKLL